MRLSMGGIIQEWMQEVMNKLGHTATVNNSMEKILENRLVFGKLEILKQRLLEDEISRGSHI